MVGEGIDYFKKLLSSDSRKALWYVGRIVCDRIVKLGCVV